MSRFREFVALGTVVGYEGGLLLAMPLILMHGAVVLSEAAAPLRW